MDRNEPDDVVNTLLSAFLAFCGRPVYPYYLNHTNPFQIAPQSDQVLGAVIMWVLGSLIFLVPAMVIAYRLIEPRQFSAHPFYRGSPRAMPHETMSQHPRFFKPSGALDRKGAITHDAR